MNHICEIIHLSVESELIPGKKKIMIFFLNMYVNFIEIEKENTRQLMKVLKYQSFGTSLSGREDFDI